MDDVSKFVYDLLITNIPYDMHHYQGTPKWIEVKVSHLINVYLSLVMFRW